MPLLLLLTGVVHVHATGPSPPTFADPMDPLEYFPAGTEPEPSAEDPVAECLSRVC